MSFVGKKVTYIKSISRFEDRGALDGGSDGLDTINDLILLASHSLNADGYLIFEIGDGQAADVLDLVRRMEESRKMKFSCKIHKDFRNKQRFVEFLINS